MASPHDRLFLILLLCRLSICIPSVQQYGVIEGWLLDSQLLEQVLYHCSSSGHQLLQCHPSNPLHTSLHTSLCSSGDDKNMELTCFRPPWATAHIHEPLPTSWLQVAFGDITVHDSGVQSAQICMYRSCVVGWCLRGHSRDQGEDPWSEDPAPSSALGLGICAGPCLCLWRLPPRS